MMVPPMPYEELKAFERDHELIWDGVRTICLYAYTKSGGGTGMGEYPETSTAVFQNGLVLSGNPWAPLEHQVVSIHKALHENEGEW